MPNCLRCERSWKSRVENPRYCPLCKSPLWNKPYNNNEADNEAKKAIQKAEADRQADGQVGSEDGKDMREVETVWASEAVERNVVPLDDFDGAWEDPT